MHALGHWQLMSAPVDVDAGGGGGDEGFGGGDAADVGTEAAGDSNQVQQLMSVDLAAKQ